MIEIRNRWTNAIIFAHEGPSIEHAIRSAVTEGRSLANANLVDADLERADLECADLRGANLEGSKLKYARLTDANLAGANLTRANLEGTNLEGVEFEGSNLEDADLAMIREDLFAVLAITPNEVKGLLAALRAGNINGSTYNGVCACLVGTIANVRGCDVARIPGLTPNANRPAERWFLAISPDHKPENHPIAKITAEWIEEWLKNRNTGNTSVEQNKET